VNSLQKIKVQVFGSRPQQGCKVMKSTARLREKVSTLVKIAFTGDYLTYGYFFKPSVGPTLVR
jgi:hypothetical protein